VQIVRQITDLNNTHFVCGTGDRGVTFRSPLISFR